MENEMQKNSIKPLKKKFVDDVDYLSPKNTDIGDLSVSSIMRPTFDYGKNQTEGISSE